MNILFVHNNFPAQFRHVVAALIAAGRHRIAAICTKDASVPGGVQVERYEPPQGVAAHIFARRFDSECRRAEQVLYAAARLKAAGFLPDIIVAHSGWGETLPLREVFPRAKIIVYSEFYYRSRGQDVGFDPEFPEYGVDGRVSLTIKNASQLLALADADVGVSPTHWQRSTYPVEFQSKIQVIHEGIDTGRVAPSALAMFRLAPDHVLTVKDEVITYVARNLEPMRGIHSFLRALPRLLERRPKAQVVVVGGDGVSYGAAVEPPFRSWRARFWPEVAGQVDARRVHFVGQISYERYLSLIQLSSVHIYLTYPFVLSWSLLEAMSAGCAVVASDTAPVREVVSSDGGRLVSFFEPVEIANKVVDLLQNRVDLIKLQRASRDFIVENYDMNTKCRPKFMSLLEDI